jgi:hypothetical protein
MVNLLLLDASVHPGAALDVNKAADVRDTPVI